jgi:hypothetical protein
MSNMNVRRNKQTEDPLNYFEKTNEFISSINQKIKFKRLFSYTPHKNSVDECSDGIRLPEGILNELDSQ